MTKRQLIDEIMEMNQSAGPDFLCRFEQTALEEYYVHLQDAHTPRPLADEAPRPHEAQAKDAAGRSFCWTVAPERFAHDDLHQRIHRMTTQLNEILPAPPETEPEPVEEIPPWNSPESSEFSPAEPQAEETPDSNLRQTIHCLDEMDEGRAGWLF